MMFDIKTTDGPNFSSITAVAALGVSYEATIAGLLQASADPSGFHLVGAWSSGFGGESHAEVWMDMSVDRFAFDGSFDTRVVDQRSTLQSNDAWNGRQDMGTLDIFSSTPGPHTAAVGALFHVDPGYKYVIWVWCGGLVWGHGSQPSWTDKASAQMQITVPSINISLTVD